MGDDTDSGSAFDRLTRERARIDEERAKREEPPVVVDETEPVYEADVGDDAEAVDETETASLEQTVDNGSDALEERVEKVKKGLKGFGKKLGQSYRKTADAVRDAHLGDKVKDRAEKIVGGVRDAHLGEKAKTRAGKIADGVGTVTGTVAGAVTTGTKTGAEKFRDAKDKVRGIANPEKQLATLKELADLVMLYDPGAGTNPNLRKAEGVTSSVLVVGNTGLENLQLVDELVTYVQASAAESGYSMVIFDEFKDFEKYAAERTGEEGPECRIVRINKSYFVEGSNMRTNTNLRKLFESAADPKGIALILAEDMELLYSQTGNRTDVLNSNARCCTGLRKVVEFQAQRGNYKGNWLLVCTTADEDGLPDCVEDIVEMEL